MTASRVDPSHATSDDVRQLFRRSNWIVSLGLLIILTPILVIVGVSFSNKDDLRLGFANNARSACITERRNAETSATGDMQEAALLAGYLRSASPEAIAAAQKAIGLTAAEASPDGQVVAGIEAIGRRRDARDALKPEILNAEPPVGCGPPISSKDQIPKETP